MRLLKLSLLVLIACCTLAQPQPSPAQSDTAVSIPPHSTSQLSERINHARWMTFLSASVARSKEQATGRFKVDPYIAAAIPGGASNTCFKLRKYIFQPKEQTEKNGMRPLGDEMQFAGETDCTYANKVWPKSADGVKPPRPQFGLQSAVARQK